MTITIKSRKYAITILNTMNISLLAPDELLSNDRLGVAEKCFMGAKNESTKNSLDLKDVSQPSQLLSYNGFDSLSLIISFILSTKFIWKREQHITSPANWNWKEPAK